jgi:hypothetical protein
VTQCSLVKVHLFPTSHTATDSTRQYASLSAENENKCLQFKYTFKGDFSWYVTQYSLVNVHLFPRSYTATDSTRQYASLSAENENKYLQFKYTVKGNFS